MDASVQIPSEPLTAEAWSDKVRVLSADAHPDRGLLFRRKDPRWSLGLGVVQFVVAFDGRRVTETGNLLNVSAGGVMIQFRKRLEMGQTLDMVVYVDDEPFRLVGRVNHCTMTLGSYKIGVALVFAEQAD